MLPANLLNTIKALVLDQKPLITANAEATPKTNLFEPGQKVQGSVQAQVAPNVFKVNVAGQLIQMQLPPSIRSGDTVALQVISIQPRLTFGMVNSANPLSTPEQLGSTAKLLSSMSQQVPGKAHVRAAQSAPLWEKPQPPESRQLAGALRETLGNSGLFYESHQAQWLEGTRSTAQLLHEPQNQTPEQPKAAMPGDTGNKAAMTGDAASKAAAITGKDQALTSNSSNPAATTSNTAHTSASNPPGTTLLQEAKALGIPEHLQPLVQQQLNALETRQMLWQGNVWPDQPMQWEVHEQPAQQSHNAEEQQRQWVTQIRLDLPNLGEVEATLRFNSAGLNLTLNAATAETRALLGSASTRLVSALSDAGIPVLSTQVTTA